jgi:hypothetical protein
LARESAVITDTVEALRQDMHVEAADELRRARAAFGFRAWLGPLSSDRRVTRDSQRFHSPINGSQPKTSAGLTPAARRGTVKERCPLPIIIGLAAMAPRWSRLHDKSHRQDHSQFRPERLFCGHGHGVSVLPTGPSDQGCRRGPGCLHEMADGAEAEHRERRIAFEELLEGYARKASASRVWKTPSERRCQSGRSPRLSWRCRRPQTQTAICPNSRVSQFDS